MASSNGVQQTMLPGIEQHVGDYIIEREIGHGSFATVYKGHHKYTNEAVAIKSVRRSKLTKKLLENLASEINILKGIRHDHIVALVDCKETENDIHLVMEYCAGGDLSQYIKRRDGTPSLPPPPSGGLNEVIVRHFLKQLASALEFLRSKNLIHRDLKPQNLLLHPVSQSEDTSGYGLPTLKVADFGFARSLPHLSLAETLCGSPLYMAPEILRYEKYDAKADLWSVGTVLYEMCTGKPPFRAQNHVELLKRIEMAQDVITFPGEIPTTMERNSSSSPAPSPSSNHALVAPVSEDIRNLIRQLLKRNPVERISFEEFFMDPTVSTLHQAPSRSSRRESRHSADLERGHKEAARKPSVANMTRYPPETLANTRDPIDIRRDTSSAPIRDTQDKYSEPPRSRPRSIRRNSPSSMPDSRPPLQLPLSLPLHHYQQQQQQGVGSPSEPPSHSPVLPSPSSRKMRSLDSGIPDSPVRMQAGGQPSSQPHRRSTLIAVPDVSRRHSAPEDDALLDKDYVVVEKRAVELNVLADEVAASPKPASLPKGTGGPLSPPIPAALTQYKTPPPPFMPNPYSASHSPPSNNMYFSTTPPFAVSKASEEPMQVPFTKRSNMQPVGLTNAPRSSSPREGGASVLAKAISMASIRLFGAASSPPKWPRGQASPSNLAGFGTQGQQDPSQRGQVMQVNPEEEEVLQKIEDTAQKAYVVTEFADSKLEKAGTPLVDFDLSSLSLKDDSSTDHSATAGIGTPSTIGAGGVSGPTREGILAEEAFFLYLRALALLQSGMDVARRYWEEKRAQNKAASARLNSGVQWIRDRFNECLEKAENAKIRSGIDDREESGVVIEKLLYERALELSKSAALKELVSDDYAESERSYQTSIWMLHAILDGAGEDGRSEAIEDDDREILNKFIKSIETRLSMLRRRMAGLRS
ncbi:Serine/threonine-protein kinase [Actinomortierella ambigua]|nr:Serine/threonine-protein kinase [Actinomortierella ambigua]